jgi:hypothetical protein
LQVDFEAAAGNSLLLMDRLKIITSLWMPPPQLDRRGSKEGDCP